jgi:serine/threonine protein kinase
VSSMDQLHANNSAALYQAGRVGMQFVIGSESYIVERELGAGVTSRVFACRSAQHHTHVTVKASRPEQNYATMCRDEIENLIYLKHTWQKDHSSGLSPCIALLNHFEQGASVCMMFEGGALALDEKYLQKQRANEPWLLAEVQHIAAALLDAVQFLQEHAGMIHTDIKLENIVLYPIPSAAEQQQQFSVLQSRVVLIDFGHATFLEDAEPVVIAQSNVTEADQFLIGTAPYRAPELTAGQHWGHGVDLWAIGCTILQLCNATNSNNSSSSSSSSNAVSVYSSLQTTTAAAAPVRDDSSKQAVTAAAAAPTASAEVCSCGSTYASCAVHGITHLPLLRLLGDLLTEQAADREDVGAVIQRNASFLQCNSNSQQATVTTPDSGV